MLNKYLNNIIKNRFSTQRQRRHQSVIFWIMTLEVIVMNSSFLLLLFLCIFFSPIRITHAYRLNDWHYKDLCKTAFCKKRIFSYKVMIICAVCFYEWLIDNNINTVLQLIKLNNIYICICDHFIKLYAYTLFESKKKQNKKKQ